MARRLLYPVVFSVIEKLQVHLQIKSQNAMI